MFLVITIILIAVAYFILKPRTVKRKERETYKYEATQEEEKSLESKDAYETGSINFAGGDEYRSSFEIEIEYNDKNGLNTTRRIKVKSFRVNEMETEAEIYGYCYLRDAGRTFYATRIKRCVDVDTGEIIKRIPPFLKAKYFSTAEGQFELWLERRKCDIEVLVYIGRLDTQLRKNEREIIIEYVKSKETELKVTTEAIEDYLKVCGKISKAMFGRHLTKLASGGDEDKNDLIETCEKIVGTKKTNTTEELNAMENIKRRLASK